MLADCVKCLYFFQTGAYRTGMQTAADQSWAASMSTHVDHMLTDKVNVSTAEECSARAGEECRPCLLTAPCVDRVQRVLQLTTHVSRCHSPSLCLLQNVFSMESSSCSGLSELMKPRSAPAGLLVQIGRHLLYNGLGKVSCYGQCARASLLKNTRTPKAFYQPESPGISLASGIGIQLPISDPGSRGVSFANFGSLCCHN